MVEGAKNVLELLNSDFEIQNIYLSDTFYKENTNIWQKSQKQPEIVENESLLRISTLANNTTALAVVKTKKNLELLPDNEWILVLDDINDPGNLGTIIRIADWYGIRKIICSENTVELYNPKVISATMGSFTRVSLFYSSLEKYLGQQNTAQIFATTMTGKSVYDTAFESKGILVIGSEANGISDEILSKSNHKITIPNRGGGAESLNAGVATAIILDNIFRG